MLKREWGAESTYSIHGKTSTLVPDFAVRDLPLGRTTALVPEFAVKEHSDNFKIQQNKVPEPRNVNIRNESVCANKVAYIAFAVMR